MVGEWVNNWDFNFHVIINNCEKFGAVYYSDSKIISKRFQVHCTEARIICASNT